MDMNNMIEKAKLEEIPEIDVTHKVLMRIQTRRDIVTSIKPMGIFAGISAIAASIILICSINSYKYLTSPIMDLFAPLQSVSLY